MKMTNCHLSWDSFKTNICNGFSILQQREEFVDLTLAADSHLVKVHRNLIALASPYIKDILKAVPCQHPVIFLNNISHTILCYILEYIYTGEIEIPLNEVNSFIEAAKALHIKGLENVMPPATVRSKVAARRVRNSGQQETSSINRTEHVSADEIINSQISSTAGQKVISNPKVVLINRVNTDEKQQNDTFDDLIRNLKDRPIKEVNNDESEQEDDYFITNLKVPPIKVVNNDETKQKDHFDDLTTENNAVVKCESDVVDTRQEPQQLWKDMQVPSENKKSGYPGELEIDSNNLTKDPGPITVTKDFEYSIVSKINPEGGPLYHFEIKPIETTRPKISTWTHNKSDEGMSTDDENTTVPGNNDFYMQPPAKKKLKLGETRNISVGKLMAPQYQRAGTAGRPTNNYETSSNKTEVGESNNSNETEEPYINVTEISSDNVGAGEPSIFDEPVEPRNNSGAVICVRQKAPDTSTTIPYYTLSTRGSVQLILNRYIYSCHHISHGGRKRRWRCIDYRLHRCKAYIDTDGEIIMERIPKPQTTNNIWRYYRLGYIYSDDGNIHSSFARRRYLILL